MPEYSTYVGVREFEINIPTISKHPSLAIILTSTNEKILTDTLKDVLPYLLPHVLESSHYIHKHETGVWSSIIITALRDDVDEKDLLEGLKSRLRNVKDLKYEIVSYTRVFRNLYIISAKPVIMMLHERAYVLPATFMGGYLKSLIETLEKTFGSGVAPILRECGQRVGDHIAQFLRRTLSKDDLNVDMYELLYSLMLFAFYTDQLPYCSKLEKTNSVIRIRLKEDLKDEKLKVAIAHLNYGIIEKLIEAFGFESVIKREEKLELIVAIGERKITIRAE